MSQTIQKHLTIDFVSDVSCPWCIIGLKALDQALERTKDTITTEIRFQPFELNPQMGPEGQEINEHLIQKYRISQEQANANREAIRVRGAQLGFEFKWVETDGTGRGRIYNTFDAHRLLHWAELTDLTKQRALKESLFDAYFTRGKSPASHELLIEMAGTVGLDIERAKAILQTDEYAKEVREQEQHFQRLGINSVPAVIVNKKHLISGGQPVEVFEQALRQIAAE